jgi:hypothetical protein
MFLAKVAIVAQGVIFVTAISTFFFRVFMREPETTPVAKLVPYLTGTTCLHCIGNYRQ